VDHLAVDVSSPVRCNRRRPHGPGDRRIGSALVEAAFWIAAFGTLVLTFVYSLGAAPSALNSFPIADKVFHASAYGAITLTWLAAV